MDKSLVAASKALTASIAWSIEYDKRRKREREFEAKLVFPKSTPKLVAADEKGIAACISNYIPNKSTFLILFKKDRDVYELTARPYIGIAVVDEHPETEEQWDDIRWAEFYIEQNEFDMKNVIHHLSIRFPFYHIYNGYDYISFKFHHPVTNLFYMVGCKLFDYDGDHAIGFRIRSFMAHT